MRPGQRARQEPARGSTRSPIKRRSLLGNELTLIHPGWVRQAHTVSPTELPAILAADFSIELTARDAQALRHLRALSPAGTPVKANDRPEKQRAGR